MLEDRTFPTITKLQKKRANPCQSNVIQELSESTFQLLLKRIRQLEEFSVKRSKNNIEAKTLSKEVDHTECIRKDYANPSLTNSFHEDLFDNRDFDTYKIKDYPVFTTSNICQLDGNDEISSEDNFEHPCKEIYAVNCIDKQIINLVNFFRSFNSLWISLQNHQLCSLDQNCFFLFYAKFMSADQTRAS